MRHALRMLSLLWLGGCGLAAADELAVPYLSGRVVDQAEILTAPARERIASMLQAHEQTTSNQIAVLGGLMQNKVSKSNAGIPLLSSLPWIGHLFSYKDDELTKTELVIFLRPTVMRNASLSAELKDFRRFLPEVAPGLSPAPNVEPAR